MNTFSSKQIVIAAITLAAIIGSTVTTTVASLRRGTREHIAVADDSVSARPISPGTTRPATSPFGRFDEVLEQLRELILEERVSLGSAESFSVPDAVRFTTLKEVLVAEDQKNRSNFREMEATIEQKSLPVEIRERLRRFVADYRSRFETLKMLLDQIESTHNTAVKSSGLLIEEKTRLREVADQANAFLTALVRRPQPGFDPHNLPLTMVRREPPVPKLTRDEWQAAFSTETARKNRNVGQEPLGSDPPSPADLGETIEIKFTPEIHQLANSLGRNPVKIFNWVRSNIEFVPTWGSIQGAQVCLESRVCNSFDTSSLLIALLRVSNIPARYQMGTIEVPIERFKNWAGGVNDAGAAASLFASGGIPAVVRRVNQSGQVASVKLEHTWVKAFVDYEPSGGAINVQGDTWVDLDAGFKQYTIQTGLQDLTSIVPFNRDAYLSSATTESPVSYYRQLLSTYVHQNFPGRTLNDFLTRRTIRSSDLTVLAPGLPYGTVIRGVSFAEIPQTLRQRITIQIARAGAQTAITRSLPEIVGKRLTLSFIPATAADIATATGFAGLYKTPPYLLSVKPVFRLDGQVVVTGAPVGMAQSLDMTFTLAVPNGNDRAVHNEITAGNYLSFFFAQNFVSDRYGERVARDFRRVDNRFGTLNIDNSDRDPWIGGGLLGLGAYYFNQLDAGLNSLRQLFPIAETKTAFVAYTSSDLQVTSLFGTPAGSKLASMSIDADLLEDFAVSRNGSNAPVTAFEILRGLESSYWEHGIFEAAGLDPNRPGISTVKILKRARAAGIQVVEVNAGNINAIEPQLQLTADVKEAVRDATNAGLTVITPVSNVQLGSWHGVGYIVEDPQTGAGAYQISGGLSGGGLALEQPGLGGGTLPPNQPLWPSAVLAVGTPLIPSLRGVLDQQINNSWSVLEEIGLPLYAAGHNVYVKEVFAEDIVSFVLGTGARTDNDVFFYVGHGFNGTLAVPNRDSEGYGAIGPGDFSGRHFRLVLLSACATGGDCSGDLIHDVINGCTPNEGYQIAWEAALLGPAIGGHRHEQALVGSVNTIRSFQAAPGNRLFFTGMAFGVTVDTAESFIEASYLRGDPTTTLQGFGR